MPNRPPAPQDTPLPLTAPGAAGKRDTPRCITSASLLGGSNELLIEHRGLLYRLRQTSLGKLILTK
jgi:hemin uptake protein HemP